MNDHAETLTRLLQNPQVHLTELTVLPTGCDMPDMDWYAFSATVHPTSEGWAVRRSTGLYLSPSTGHWNYANDDGFDQQSFRYSLSEAIEAAQVAVNVLTVNGKTFAQWETLRETLQKSPN